MTRGSRGQQLRCFCAHKPLLGIYGIDNRGKLFVHIKVYKADRVFGEVIVTGDVKIRCRDCYRWHTVVIIQPDRAVLQESTDPEIEADVSDTG
jgi:hypothetical protein